MSQAFKKDLNTRFGLEASTILVLYDRAVKGKFGPIGLVEKHELFERVGWSGMFTQKDQATGKITEMEKRPVLMLTSTSYTPDEDIGILLGALYIYSQKAQKTPQLPSIHLIVTGAGPLKKMYLKKFEEFNNSEVTKSKVKIEAKWLEIDDYPKMVAAADLGVCLHLSSSNLDLPMKVVDMYSCKVPCFAYDYPTIGELVKATSRGETKSTGALFKCEDSLHGLLLDHFKGGLQSALASLTGYRDNLDVFVSQTWEDHWNDVMLGSIFQKKKAQ